MSQQIVNLPLPESTLPDFINDPNIAPERKKMMLDEYNRQIGQQLPPLSPQQPQPQVIDVAPQNQPQPIIGNAGAQRNGVDWRGLLGTLASYGSAAAQAYGSSANPSQGLLNATKATGQHTQNINQYKTMQPYYQQMGYDVSRLDPRRSGVGVSSTPESMIQLQSLVDQRNMNNLYRQQMIQSLQQRDEQKQQSNPTVGDLMLYNPQFKAMMNAQYDFSNGRNADILKRPMPKEVLQSLMPKNVNMRYSGGLNSSKTSSSTVKHVGGSGGKSGGSKKLIF